MMKRQLSSGPARWALVIALAVALSACGGSSDSTELAAVDEVAEDAAASDAPQDEAADAANDEPQSLADYLGNAAGARQALGAAGLGGGGFGGDEDEALEEQRQIQIEIQVCMQAQGFEYVPEQVGDGLRIFAAAQNQGVDAADYAATEGFGISTRFDELLEGDVEVEESTDPNGDHVATLSEGEADAWNLALNGAPPERNAEGQIIDPETGEALGRNARGQAGGCRLTAQTEVRGDALVLGELEDEIELLADRISSDSRLTEIAREWIDCMNAEGFDYTTENEARADIQSQVGPLLRSFFASAGNDGDGDGDGGGGGQGRQGGGNQLQAIAGLQLTAEQEADLQALQDLERSIAVASLACQGDTAEEVAEITARYEAEFIEVNRSALEALSS